MRIEIAGENSLIIYFANQPNANISAKIQHCQQQIKQQFADVIIELIPSYASLLVTFQPLKTDVESFTALLEPLINAKSNELTSASKLIELPAYYDEQFGPDLKRIAEHSQLSVAEVISLHQQLEYRVYAIGFAPGFAYLGDVDPRIATPRLTTPRQQVPKGAIAIADRQTAVYPSVSPGGWNLIGLCPTPMFNAQQPPYMAINVGDRVRFVGINQAEFIKLGGELTTIENGIV